MKQSTNEKIIKLFRVIFWGVSIVFISVGASLMRLAETSASYADGTVEAKYSRGQAVFVIALIVGILNLIWGITRWILRWRREKWTAGKVIGKLIGGGIWRTLAIIPVILLSLIFLAPAIAKNIGTRFAYQYNAYSLASSHIISSDFEKGKLTAEQYVNYLYDALYDIDRLPGQYRSLEPELEIDLLSIVDEHLDELGIETITKVANSTMLSNIKFDVDASNNISHHDSWFSTAAYAQTTKATVLNKAKYSSNSHFIIFYTDTGDDAVSEENVSKLGAMLEKIVDGYKNKLNLDYSYSPVTVSDSKDDKIKEVLKYNGIAENALDTAMPVYIAKPEAGNSGVLASYAGLDKAKTINRILFKIESIIGDDDAIKNTAKFYTSVPGFPFINIYPQNLSAIDLESVTSHEIGHHFSYLYCSNKYGEECSYNSFVSETVANYMAVRVSGDNTTEKNVIGGHYASYINGGLRFPLDEIVTPPSQLLGYPAFPFLLYYSDNIKNGEDIIFQALHSDQALQFLYDKAGAEGFSKVMAKLAEGNLIGTYNNIKILQPYKKLLPVGEEAPCVDMCSKDYTVSRASMRYVYFPTLEYNGRKIEIKNNSSIVWMGKKSSGNWELIKTENAQSEYVVDRAKDHYETIAAALINSDIVESYTASIKVVDAQLADVINPADSLGGFAFSLPTDILTPIGDGCYAVNTNSLMEIPRQMLGLGDNLLKLVETIDISEDYSALRAEYNAESQELQQGISEAKAELAQFYVTICANVLNETNFDSAKSKVQSSMGFNMNINDYSFDGYRTSMFVGGDIMTQTAKLYSLNQLEDGLFLVTLNIKEK